MERLTLRPSSALVARGNYTYLSGHSLLLLGSLPVRSGLRRQRQRRRERRQRQQRQPRRQSDGQGFGPEFRTLRGGAQSKQEKLLAGLAALISSCQEEEEQEAPRRPPSEEDGLFEALRSLVERRPSNLLQELKSLVQKFSRGQRTVTAEGQQALAKSKGKGKGAGAPAKGGGPKPVTQPVCDEGEWVAVMKGRQQKHAKPKQAHAQAKPEVGRARPGDWTHPKMRLEEVRRWSLMWDLMAAYDKVPVTLVFNYDTGVGFPDEFEEVQGFKPDLCQMPLVFTNGLRFVRRNVVKRGDGAPLLKAKTMQELRLWAMVACPGLGRQWRDSWGWEARAQIHEVQGLIRVDLALATALLSQSGRAHIGGRWLLEPLRWEAPLQGIFKHPPLVQWVEEADLARACAQADRDASSFGMGLRCRLWRFHGIPMKWQFVAKVEILERFKWRGKAGWSLRASRNDALDHLVLEVEGESVLASCCWSAGQRRPGKPLRCDAAVRVTDRPAAVTRAGEAMPFTAAVRHKAPEPDKAQDDAEMPAAEGPTKRANGPALGPASKKQSTEAYLDAVAKPSSWGSALEIQALAHTGDRPIFVFAPAEGNTLVFTVHFEALEGEISLDDS
ncbi:unnamed protein product [Effrenium voratum]|uniref:OTU domain-containing protein n=1 Tax=Effrenium voratum TaxID=2562239 RepID=A0AA36JMI4_9DINO|nr:unnamed protein product [Effrenium voratum]